MKRKCDNDGDSPKSTKIKGSGLYLIQEYDDDDDDVDFEEESKVNDKEQKVSSPKQILKLKVPAEVTSMFQEDCDNNKVIDNEEVHGGRVRSFPHVRGNWASFVALPCRDKNIMEMSSILNDALSCSNLKVKMDFVTTIHMSLSKTIVFRHHWIDSFISELKNHLINVERFSVIFDEFDVYINEEKTTTFIGMKICSSPVLEKLVNTCDLCLNEYKLESYYQNPSFHISLAWFVGDHSQLIKENLLPVLNKRWKSLAEQDEALRLYDIESVDFKYGNKLSTFKLC